MILARLDMVQKLGELGIFQLFQIKKAAINVI